MMTGGNEKFRPIENAPEWSHEVFDTCAELAELLERHSYRFARTMPGAPHSYTLKRAWPREGRVRRDAPEDAGGGTYRGVLQGLLVSPVQR